MFKKNVVVLLFVIFLSTELTGVLSKIDKATKFGKTGSPTKLLEKLSEEFAKLGECKHCHRTPKIESVEYLTTSSKNDINDDINYDINYVKNYDINYGVNDDSYYDINYSINDDKSYYLSRDKLFEYCNNVFEHNSLKVTNEDCEHLYAMFAENPKLGLTEEECGNMVEYLCEYYYS
ncbi:uncharacterized protein LOC126901555 isoform X3 [Daktulosphaira vitifoliae]|uniref:uncharacterized protein LOC126901555 isoform X3 n=1 Tax=Daktulosphaira vitifoliae TaxID=58002 RepID=UPI0021AAF640|nr:uncharacterized protein LOC126901555 isoform X3 [Daktulosphaira vitifoliae]